MRRAFGAESRFFLEDRSAKIRLIGSTIQGRDELLFQVSLKLGDAEFRRVATDESRIEMGELGFEPFDRRERRKRDRADAHIAARTVIAGAGPRLTPPGD